MNAQASVARISKFHDAQLDASFAPQEADVSELINEIARLRSQVGELTAALTKAQGKGSDKDHGSRTAAIIKNVIEARSRRGSFLPPALFADPAWDMLLDLFLAHKSQLRISISSLCIAANVPSTTAHRWVRHLEEEGLATRRGDPLDARRNFVELTPNAIEALSSYFATLPASPGVL